MTKPTHSARTLFAKTIRHRLTHACLVGAACVVSVRAAAENTHPEPATIVIAEKAPEVVRWAAQELQDAVQRVSGEHFALATDTEDVTGRRILLGQSAATDRLGIEPIFEADAFLIRSAGDVLILMGDDKDSPAPGKGIPFNIYTSRKGTLFAVYEFLERFLDIRWFWPGETGTVAPRRSAVEWPADLDLRQAPHFAWRHAFLYDTRDLPDSVRNHDIPLWYLRSRLGIAWGTQFSFGHSWGGYLTNELFDRHPEYYALIDGERKPFLEDERGRVKRQSRQLCTSNPEVVALFVERIRANFSPDEEGLASVSPNDGLGFCECADCVALDHPELYGPEDGYGGVVFSDRVFTFVNEVAREVRKTHPKVRLGIFAYTVLRTAPRALDHLEDNVVVSMTQIHSNFSDPAVKAQVRGQIAEWLKLGAHCVGRDYYSLHYGVSHPQFSIIEEDLQFMGRNNFSGFYWEGETDFAANHPNYYLISKLLWDPKRRAEDILDDYYRRAYGPAADTVRAYFELLEASFVARQPADGIYMGNTPNWYSRETLERAGRLLDEAETKGGGDDGVRERLAYLRFGHRYTEMALRFTRLCKTLGDNGISIRMKAYEPQPAAEPASREQIDAWLREAKDAGEAFYNFVHQHRETGWLSEPDVLNFNERTFRTLKSVREQFELRAADNRTLIPLPVHWKFRIDPEDVGEKEGWETTDHDDSGWGKIRVDAFWEEQGYGAKDGYPGPPGEKGTKYKGYNGIAWYRLSDLRLPEDTPPEARYDLRIGAVDEDAWVYVNGKLCGTVLYDAENEPDGWKLPRLIRVDEALRSNEANTIAIRVRDTTGGGGVWQGVSLVIESPAKEVPAQTEVVFLENFTGDPTGQESMSNCTVRVEATDHGKALHVIVEKPFPAAAYSRSWSGIPVEPGRDYVASFRYRSAAVRENPEFKQRWRRTPVVPQVRIFARDAGGKACQPASDYVWFGGVFRENTESRTPVRRIFRTPPEAATLWLTLYLHAQGEYYIDEIRIDSL